jgi:hypothetical protein
VRMIVEPGNNAVRAGDSGAESHRPESGMCRVRAQPGQRPDIAPLYSW